MQYWCVLPCLPASPNPRPLTVDDRKFPGQEIWLSRKVNVLISLIYDNNINKYFMIFLSNSSGNFIPNRIQQYNTVCTTNITNSRLIIDIVMWFCWWPPEKPWAYQAGSLDVWLKTFPVKFLTSPMCIWSVVVVPLCCRHRGDSL